ncbi:MAG: glycogen synthase GlgA [Deltaproteobacteria bacterium]|nr:MAG: glycogen synthase GlgA [Deltaproteobacteria bacterium]
MSKKQTTLRILMVFPEVVPFAKTGGLADVAGALPCALSQLGCDVRIVMPLYTRLLGQVIASGPTMEDLSVPFGSQILGADVYEAKLNDDVRIYFIRRDEFFDRSHLYGTEKAEYFDNAQRFVYFCRAVLALCQAVRFRPQVVHCHDWQSGLIPAYLKLSFGSVGFWTETRSIFTIHNIGYQGRFGAELYPLTGLPYHFFDVGGIEFWGDINFMKAAIVSADEITTVSPRYSKEIQTPEYGQGLEGILQTHRRKLHGIINGADYQNWNPETDPHIAANYSRDDLQGKLTCKRDLLREVGLPKRLMKRPLLGVISRLADQKGLDLLAEVIEKVVAEDVGLVILGRGEERYHLLLTELASRYPRKIAVRLEFNERMAHRIEAGADMFLMPSRYEPCGLNQMYSLRYGTVPIVRATGGLYDTVKPYDPKRGEGVGFRFTAYKPEAFWQAIKRAIKLFNQPKTWRKIMKNGMAKDFSWQASALRYLALYERILGKP